MGEKLRFILFLLPSLLLPSLVLAQAGERSGPKEGIGNRPLKNIESPPKVFRIK